MQIIQICHLLHSESWQVCSCFCLHAMIVVQLCSEANWFSSCFLTSSHSFLQKTLKLSSKQKIFLAETQPKINSLVLDKILKTISNSKCSLHLKLKTNFFSLLQTTLTFDYVFVESFYFYWLSSTCISKVFEVVPGKSILKRVGAFGHVSIHFGLNDGKFIAVKNITLKKTYFVIFLLLISYVAKK